jgi:hypothetical protein
LFSTMGGQVASKVTEDIFGPNAACQG